MMGEGKYITEYEKVIAGKLAYVMTGGELSKPQWVSEQYILDLEREAFLSLCGEEKTQARCGICCRRVSRCGIIGTADYVRVMRISLGEARETQGWYFRARHVLPKDLMERRSRVLTQVISLLVTAIDGTKKTLRKK
jgi:hypothetical protein